MWHPSGLPQGSTLRICGIELVDDIVGEKKSRNPLKGYALKQGLDEFFRRYCSSEGMGIEYKRLPLVNVGSQEDPYWEPMECLR